MDDWTSPQLQAAHALLLNQLVETFPNHEHYDTFQRALYALEDADFALEEARMYRRRTPTQRAAE